MSNVVIQQVVYMQCVCCAACDACVMGVDTLSPTVSYACQAAVKCHLRAADQPGSCVGLQSVTFWLTCLTAERDDESYINCRACFSIPHQLNCVPCQRAAISKKHQDAAGAALAVLGYQRTAASQNRANIKDRRVREGQGRHVFSEDQDKGMLCLT